MAHHSICMPLLNNKKKSDPPPTSPPQKKMYYSRWAVVADPESSSAPTWHILVTVTDCLCTPEFLTLRPHNLQLEVVEL